MLAAGRGACEEGVGDMTEPGWYKDPRDPERARWHDGAAFTEHTIVMAEHTAPPPDPTRAQPAFTAAPLGTSTPQPGPTRQDLRADAAAAKARAKAMRPWYRKKRFVIPLAVVVLGIIIGAANSGGDKNQDTSTAATGASGSTASTAPVSKVLHVGESDTTSGFQVTLLTVEAPFKRGPYEPAPDPDKAYIGVELQVKNNTNDTRTMSSLMGLEIRDAAGERFDITLVGTDRPQLDGDVPAGGLLKGWAVFEVPNSATGLQLHVAGSITASGIDYDLGVR
jgi:hypothetical protein